MKIRFVRRRRKRLVRLVARLNPEKELENRAQAFNKKYFQGKLRWQRIYYSPNQNSRMFGNCNTRHRTIRLSSRLLKMPQFVHDYVLVHELAHLQVARHGSGFWKLVNQYPKTERAKGYLMAICHKV